MLEQVASPNETIWLCKAGSDQISWGKKSEMRFYLWGDAWGKGGRDWPREGNGTGNLVGRFRGSAWTCGPKAAVGRISVAFWLGSGVLKWANVAICVQTPPELTSLCEGRIWLYMEHNAWCFIMKIQCTMRKQQREPKHKNGCREGTLTCNERGEVCELWQKKCVLWRWKLRCVHKHWAAITLRKKKASSVLYCSSVKQQSTSQQSKGNFQRGFLSQGPVGQWGSWGGGQRGAGAHSAPSVLRPSAGKHTWWQKHWKDTGRWTFHYDISVLGFLSNCIQVCFLRKDVEIPRCFIPVCIDSLKRKLHSVAGYSFLEQVSIPIWISFFKNIGRYSTLYVNVTCKIYYVWVFYCC